MAVGPGPKLAESLNEVEHAKFDQLADQFVGAP